MASSVAQACCYPKCAAKHLEDPVLAWIHQLTPELCNVVFSQVLGQKQPTPSFKTRSGLETIYDLLNTTAHTTAYSLAFSVWATRERSKRMHSGINTHIENQYKTLREVARQLNEGKNRKEIISDVREHFRKTLSRQQGV